MDDNLNENRFSGLKNTDYWITDYWPGLTQITGLLITGRPCRLLDYWSGQSLHGAKPLTGSKVSRWLTGLPLTGYPVSRWLTGLLLTG